MSRMTTAELLKSQLDYATLQVDALEKQIGIDDQMVPAPILRRVQDQFRELASCLRVALQMRA